MVCPIRAGGGVSIKVAESLYNGIPVLATTNAVVCFTCSSGSGLVVLDDAAVWVDLLNSPGEDQLASQVPSEDLRHFRLFKKMGPPLTNLQLFVKPRRVMKINAKKCPLKPA